MMQRQQQKPFLAVRFTQRGSSDKLISLVEQRLQNEGMIVVSKTSRQVGGTTSLGVDGQHRRKVVLVLSATQQALEEEAESIHLIKLTTKSKTMERFKIERRSDFITENNSVFTSSESILLAERIFRETTVLVPGGGEKRRKSDLSEALVEDNYYQRCDLCSSTDNNHNHHNSGGESSGSAGSSAGSCIDNNTLLADVLVMNGYVDIITPVHDTTNITHQQLSSQSQSQSSNSSSSPKSMRETILKQTCWPWYQIMPPCDEIQKYYGWEIGFYFGFLGFLSQWLVFPAIIGIFFFTLRMYRQDTLDDDEYTPFFGLLTFLWSIVMLCFWEREENKLSYKYGTYTLSDYEKQKYFVKRPQFTGTMRISPVTGKPELYYSPLKRRLKYVVSFIVTVAMLAVAFGLMILSLNLQGYINPKHNAFRWSSSPHPFHYPAFAVLAEEGRIFDATSYWRVFIPVIIHVICIFTMNSLYRELAGILTDWENHENQVSHNNSLVLKRFLFEAFDCYVALFYLAFYERDCDRLHAELVAVFQVDTVRRVLLESVVPILLARQRGAFKSKKKDSMVSNNQAADLRRRNISIPSTDDILREIDLDLYEDFDDYMEMIIQIGYVTLFASAYTLAPVVAIVANWVEMRNDIVKLSRVCRRPTIRRTAGLGMWKTLTKCVVWLSALTNCLIAGFTSDQLVKYMPDFYIQARDDYTSLEHDKGWLVVFVIFGLEHIMIVVGFLITAIIPTIPQEVSESLERNYHEQSQRRLLQKRNSRESVKKTS